MTADAQNYENVTVDEDRDPFEDMRDAKPWLALVDDSEKAFEKYQERCDKIEDEFGKMDRLAGIDRSREFQIFWANMSVLKPSVYSRPPVPVVTSRFKDRKPLNRHASEMLERTLITSFDAEKVHESVMCARDDLVMNARGVLWMRYDVLKGMEKVCWDHVDRTDFCHDAARKWKEVDWCARRSWLTYEQWIDRFEETSGDLYTEADFKERDTDKQDEYKGEKKAAVWELWSKSRNVVVWVSPGVSEVLDISEPYLELDDFFPCPKPAYGTVEPRSLKPISDFLYYKDQIEEINSLTSRIHALSEALRLKGFIAGGSEDVGEAIETAMKQLDDNAILIPVPNMAALGGEGLRNAIVWVPLKEVAETVAALVALRKQVIEDVYQITGISDIMRGETEASETLGAQQLKSQYGTIRIRHMQDEIVRLCRDCTRIAGEIIAENFRPETIMAMSQYEDAPPQAQIDQQIMQMEQQIAAVVQNPEAQQMAAENPEQAQQMAQQAQAQLQELQNTVTLEQVFEFIQDQRMRPFVLDIETDSTIQPDENAQKQRATEFLGALAQALAQLAPMVTQQPKAAPFAAEVLKFAVAPFRAGRELEAAIDQFADDMKEAAGQQPDYQAQQIEMEQQTRQQQMEMEVRKLDAEIQAKQAELALKERESVAASELAQLKAELEREKLELEELKLCLLYTSPSPRDL